MPEEQPLSVLWYQNATHPGTVANTTGLSVVKLPASSTGTYSGIKENENAGYRIQITAD
jgi:hypothetical protein